MLKGLGPSESYPPSTDNLSNVLASARATQSCETDRRHEATAASDPSLGLDTDTLTAKM